MSSLGPSWAPSETIHNINFCVTLVSGNFLFRTCVAQYAPYTTVSEHGEYYFIEFFSSVRDTWRRYSRFWPQVSIFVGLKRGGKKREIWMMKNLVRDSKVSNPLYMEMERKIYILYKYVNFFFPLFCNFLTWRKGWQIYPLLLCCNKGSGKNYLYNLFIYLFCI